MKKVLIYLLSPFVAFWLLLCWLIMKAGKGLYLFGDWMSGYRWDGYEWTEEL